ncbi:MAG: hypothetical protein HN919_17480 [Verrucomicrobia bacterium]|nr:hypothetical protein [Verrucomicrobiota bacterium]MBT7068094.1 hypothetical protein [Verrucomicrobiota bacterium]MBT7700442.1 hypothetical protein [Verrucomicrobiota bacterium]
MAATTTLFAGKPLKVFILAGQSNMEGHAAVRTFEHIGMDPKTAPMLKTMTDTTGKPIVCKDVYITYLTGKLESPLEKKGKLTAGFGAQGREPKIGPEFTFGIYMQQHLNEPFLIIKTAWGGKSLYGDFRPPSAGSFEQAKRPEDTGEYYRAMSKYVNKVLADPGKYHPRYNKGDGHQVAGFVWFQGWNDMVNGGVYPNRYNKGGYDEYSKALACFIRDVRKDFKAPRMPFVIGVMGAGGPTKLYRSPRYKGVHQYFRDAMAAPASMPEFKGTVAAVLTENYWDAQLAELAEERWGKVKAKMKEAEKTGKLGRDEKVALQEKIVAELYTPEELKIMQVGKSNAGFHYLGSGKVMSQIGKGFADAMWALQGK